VSTVRSFRLLATEGVQDAVRRRVVAVVVALSILSLLLIDGCTSCTGGTIVVNGEARELPQIAGAAGALTFGVLALWCIALAGVLAAEHLTQPLDDGSATLCLARPIGRGSFAFARLSGALAIAGVTGLVLLGATAGLLNARSGLAPGPALWGMAAFAVGAVTVGGLAMAVSLVLGRLPNVLLVFALVGSVTVANALSLAGREPGGLLGALDAWGPPLASAVWVAVASWVPELPIEADPLALAVRSVVWAVLALAALGLGFGRVELGRQAP